MSEYQIYTMLLGIGLVTGSLVLLWLVNRADHTPRQKSK